MKYLNEVKPHFKRIDYTPEYIEYMEYNKQNIEYRNLQSFEITEFLDEHIEEYRGLGTFYNLENKDMNNNSMGIKITETKDKMIGLIYNLDDDNSSLINKLSIEISENVNAKILIYFKSNSKKMNYHNGLLKVYLRKNSNLELVTLQNLNENSKNFTQTDFKCELDSNVMYYDLELGSSINCCASKTRLIGDNSTMTYIPAYLVDQNRRADFEYSLLFHGKYCEGNIEARGATKDFGKKIFRGNIYFYNGCKKSKASEGEFSILLDDTIESHAIPAMLCDEDDVVGAHAASVGKVDEDRLFYLMSRGFNAKQAKKIIVESAFRPIFERIDFEDIKQSLFAELEERML